jgi:hypothetical protein
MEIQRHLGWERVQNLIEEGKSSRSGIEGEPWLELLVEEGGQSLGLLIPFPDLTGKGLPKFEHVDVTPRKIDGKNYLLVSTSCKTLFQEFYSFLNGVADTIQLEHRPPLEAVGERLTSWKELFARLKRLSAEEEAGLIGELWFLDGLIKAGGTAMLDSWTGPLGEPHDFAMARQDFEVKTTRMARRVHTVQGLAQLLPSDGKGLSIVSLQLQPSGVSKGFSLPGMIEGIGLALQSDPPRREKFRAILRDRFGYSAKDRELYEDTFILRSKARIIPVDSSCPKIVRSWIEAQAGTGPSARIVDVEYRIDVEGLGRELQDTDFFS